MKKEKFTVKCTGFNQTVEVEGERFFFNNWLKANRFFKNTQAKDDDEWTCYPPEPQPDGSYAVEIVYFDRLV